MNKKLGMLLIACIILVLIFIFLSNKQVVSNSDQYAQNVSSEKSSKNVFNNGNILDLSNQGLNKLPAGVFKNSSLEELNLSNNKLTGSLPGEIRHLDKLRVLNASNNLMTGVPAEIGQLQNLEVLDLSNNELTGLPYELGNLKRLKKLNLSGNEYSKQDLEIIKRGLSPSVEILGI